jgi:pimeloyl-ACP methyl ester carboxylesterase
MQKVRKGSDSQFVEEVSAFINALPKDRKVILVGNSFGVDSIMEAAPKLQHSVLFLGAIDAVGSAGQRILN